MSQVYSKEPNTTGQVVLNTTCGPIEIHLFCKECPTTTRAFVQSCLDGYYDNLPFHRVLDNVLIQTGQREIKEINNKAMMDDEVYNRSFCGMWERSEERDKYEVISRIQFNHRGQIALARSLSMESEEKVALRGQFFITLDATPWLNNDHVILGTVGTSPTIFNALRIGRSIVVDEKNNPTPIDLDSVKIINVSVKSNLFEDELVPNLSVPWKKKDELTISKKKEKRRKRLVGKKNLNVLSFGGEEEGTQDDFEMSSALEKSSSGMKSGHDLSSTMDKAKTPVVKEKKDLVSSRVNVAIPTATDKETSENNGQLNVTGNSVVECRKEVSNIEQEQKKLNHQEQISTPITNDHPKAKTYNNQQQKVAAVRQTTVKPRQKESQNHHEDSTSTSSASGVVEARRSKYTHSTRSHRRGDKKDRKDGDDIFDKLAAFRTRINDAKCSKQQPQQNIQEYKGQILEKSDDEDDKNATTNTNNWMKSKFSNCRKHMDHDSRLSNNSKRDDIDDYVVIDEKKSSRHSSKKRGYNK